MFLSLLEVALAKGGSVEQSIIRLAQSREPSLGIRFHLLAAYLEQGLPLMAALDKVPRLLPPTVVAMLRVGWETGDVRRVLPSCRAHLSEASSRVQKAQHYLVTLCTIIFPIQLWFFWMITIVVAPKFKEIFKDMLGDSRPELFTFFDWAITAFPALVLCLGVPVLCGVILYILGPRPVDWLEWLTPNYLRWIARPFHALARFADRGVLLVPWKRRRLQRDFSAMLALLLDAGLTEEKAVVFAAAATANRAIAARAERVVTELQRGVKLPEALRFMDDAGELRWRVANAAHAGGRFGSALAGWHDTLDARAYSQEQAVAHLVTSACVFANGAVIGLFAVGIFRLFVELINYTGEW